MTETARAPKESATECRQSTDKLKLAYLGMGIMGSAMAINLAKSGFEISVWNRSQESKGLKAAVAAGAISSPELSEVLRGSDLIFLCLSDVPDLEDLVFRDGGVAENARAGAVLIDMSTTGPACAREIAERLAARGLEFLDAPVTGGDLGARNASLTIMVGGKEAVFQRALPAFNCIGKNIHYLGPAGSGQALKLCNQILCAVNMLAVCESFRLADELGIERKQVIEICGTGAAGSWALSNLGSRIEAQNLEPGFMIKDMRKDLRLVCEALASRNLDAAKELPASSLADRRFVESAGKFADGGERKGTQAMIASYSSQVPHRR